MFFLFLFFGIFFSFFFCFCFVLFFKPESLSTATLSGLISHDSHGDVPSKSCPCSDVTILSMLLPPSAFTWQSAGKPKFKGKAHSPQVRAQSVSFPFPLGNGLKTPGLLEAKTDSHAQLSALDSVPWGLFFTLPLVPSLCPASQCLSVYSFHCQLWEVCGWWLRSCRLGGWGRVFGLAMATAAVKEPAWFGLLCERPGFCLISGFLVGPRPCDLLSVVLLAFLLQSYCQPELVVGMGAQLKVFQQKQKGHRSRAGSMFLSQGHTPSHILAGHPGLEHGASESLQNCQSL